MNKSELLAERVADKFQRYVQVETQASEESKTRPSTPGQLKLAEILRGELQTVGLADARVDQHGFVYATMPGNRPSAPVIGYLAHMDTFQGVSGRGVKPILHHNYAGGSVDLPNGVKITPADTPCLAGLSGHDLITSDGTTLLGADDKAGVAEIMAAVCRLVAEHGRPHGAIKIAFTPDEEIGQGVDHFDTEGFGALCAYTVDGGEAGEFEEENFNAENYRITITGISSHTGTARGQMVNAVIAAADLIAGIPSGMRPETTDGRLGFLHPDGIEGDPERVTMRWLIRDFTVEGLEAKKRLLRNALKLLEARYPGLKAKMTFTRGYRNMHAKLQEDPRVSAHALEAIRRAGLEPRIVPIRGGTDGARLTYMGLPCPNLFTGGVNVHGRKEFVSVQWMEKAVEVLLNLAEIWAGEK